MDSASEAIEQLLAATEDAATNNETVTPSPYNNSKADSSFRFRLDGQVILAPLMTPAKVRELKLAKQRAIELEARLSRAASSMDSCRSYPKLEQTKTYIYDSTQQTRPKTLHLRPSIPQIYVDPPTPQDQTLSSPRRKVNKITNRILHFEQEAAASPATVVWLSGDKRILRSSTSPSLNQSQSQVQLKQTEVLEQPLQRSRSFTLEEPSQVLVDHMQRLAHYQNDTIESKAKKVKPRQQSPRQTQQLEQLLERALSEAGPKAQQLTQAIKCAHRDRFQQLVQYQQQEQRRLQQEFERQQKFLIEEICAEINVSVYTPTPAQVSEYTSTGDLASSCSHSPSHTITLSSLPTTPRSLGDLDEFLSMENSCRQPTANCSSSARKRLFALEPSQSGQYDSETQTLNGLSSLPSTPRSLPLRNSSLSNSNQRNRSPLRRPPAKKTNQTISPLTTKSPQKQTKANPPPQQSRAVSKTRKVITNRPQQQQQPQQGQLELQLAASKINAGVRGYLVRRLFRTEQVQRLVQTIRDTLILVLNLHLETFGHSLDQEEPANIRLKARLLQQLCSASRTLHLIFFQTSLKERMEIIARDRKRIKTKSIALHLKQRH